MQSIKRGLQRVSETRPRTRKTHNKREVIMKALKVLLVAPSAAGTHGETRLSRDFIKVWQRAGHTVSHLALAHEYTEFSQDIAVETYMTLKSHEACCNVPEPVYEIQDGKQLGFMILKDGQFQSVATNQACTRGQLIPEDYHGRQTIPMVLMNVKPDIVISVGDYSAGMVISSSPFRPTYKHIHYATMEGNSFPILLDGTGEDNSIRTMLARCDAVITNTEVASLSLVERYGTSAKAMVIPEGIDTDTFARLPNDVRTRLRETNPTTLLRYERDGTYRLDTEDLNQTTNILSIARNTERKNIPGLLRVATEAHASNPKVRLILHVPPDSRGWNINHLIAEFRAWDIVYIHYGWTSVFSVDDRQLNQLYNIADLYLNMSNAEGWNTAVMQATSVELPVVTPTFAVSSEWGKDVLFEIEPLEEKIVPGTHIKFVVPDTEQTIATVIDLIDGALTPSDQLRSVARTYDWLNIKASWLSLFSSLTAVKG